MPSNQRGDMTQLYLSSKSRFCGLRVRVLVPRVAAVDRVAERVLGDEHLLVLPVVVERAAEQDADAEVDVDEVVGDELAVDDDARA